MLCKILRGGSAGATPIEWPSADGTAPVRQEKGARAKPGSAAGPPVQAAEIQVQVERRAGEARQAGFREGEASGRTQAMAQVQPVLDRLARTIEDLARLRPKLMHEAESDLVQLSLGIARRILWREISVDPGALTGLVRAAVEKLASQEICRVRVHPELEAGLRRALEQTGRAAAQVYPDATLERGAILFETARGNLDASVETQLAEIRRGLTDKLEGR